MIGQYSLTPLYESRSQNLCCATFNTWLCYAVFPAPVCLLREPYNPTATLDLALSLTPLFVRKIRAVIAPLDPGHNGEDLLNRRHAKGKDDRQHSPELGHGQGRRFFSQADFQVPEKEMRQHRRQHMVVPTGIFPPLIMVHTQLRFPFFEALLH